MQLVDWTECGLISGQWVNERKKKKEVNSVAAWSPHDSWATGMRPRSVRCLETVPYVSVSPHECASDTGKEKIECVSWGSSYEQTKTQSVRMCYLFFFFFGAGTAWVSDKLTVNFMETRPGRSRKVRSFRQGNKFQQLQIRSRQKKRKQQGDTHPFPVHLGKLWNLQGGSRRWTTDFPPSTWQSRKNE